MSDTSQDRPVTAAGDSALPDGVSAGGGAEAATAGPAGPMAGDPLPLDVVFGILKNRRRRVVLWYLQEESESTTLSELAEYVAAVENDKSVDALSSSERKRVYVGLYQGHLPRLHEAGVIDFDDDRGTVTVAENTDQVTRYLDRADTADRDPSHFYLGLALGGAGIYVLQGLAGAFDPFSTLIVVAVLAGIAAVALKQLAPWEGWYRPGADGGGTPADST